MYRWTVLLEHFLNWLKLKCVLSKNWEKVRYLSFFCFLIEHNIGEGCLNCTSLDIGDCQGILFSFLNKELSIAQNGLKYGNIFILIMIVWRILLVHLYWHIIPSYYLIIRSILAKYPEMMVCLIPIPFPCLQWSMTNKKRKTPLVFCTSLYDDFVLKNFII